MRRLVMSFVVTSLVLLAFLTVAEKPATAGAQAVVPINVRIGCDGENVGEFSINSQSARLSKSAGDRARFNLLGGSDVTEVQVRAKADVAWPFVGDPPSFGSGRDATTSNIDPNIQPGVYGYDLIVTCGAQLDVIDPNMDIRP